MIDSLQLTAKHQVATPVNWKHGEDVIIAGSVTDDEAEEDLSGRLEGAEALYPHRAAAAVRASWNSPRVWKDHTQSAASAALFVFDTRITSTAADTSEPRYGTSRTLPMFRRSWMK